MYGVNLSVDTPIIETLIHSTPGNYQDLPPGNIDRNEAIQTIKDNLQKGVDDKQLSSFNVTTDQTSTQIKTIPIKASQFETILNVDYIL